MNATQTTPAAETLTHTLLPKENEMNARKIAALVESEIGQPVQMITVSEDEREGLTVIGVDWPEFRGGAGARRGDVLAWSAGRGTGTAAADNDEITKSSVWFAMSGHRIEAAWCIAKINCHFNGSRLVWSVTGDSGVEDRDNLSLADARAYLSQIRDTHPAVDRVAMV